MWSLWAKEWPGVGGWERGERVLIGGRISWQKSQDSITDQTREEEREIKDLLDLSD